MIRIYALAQSRACFCVNMNKLEEMIVVKFQVYKVLMENVERLKASHVYERSTEFMWRSHVATLGPIVRISIALGPCRCWRKYSSNTKGSQVSATNNSQSLSVTWIFYKEVAFERRGVLPWRKHKALNLSWSCDTEQQRDWNRFVGGSITSTAREKEQLIREKTTFPTGIRRFYDSWLRAAGNLH